MPKRSGDLEKSMTPPIQKIEGDSIVTRLASGGGDTPYARWLYDHPEFDFYQGENKNAQGEWLQPWLPGGDLEGYIPDKFSERLRAKLQE